MTKEPLALAIAASLLVGAGPATAEDAARKAPLAQKCLAEPAVPTQPPAGGGTGDNDAKRSGEAPDSLTETLEPCNGVLFPPRVGDDEMTAPPPTVGRTPVIRPGDIPDQPPSGHAPAE